MDTSWLNKFSEVAGRLAGICRKSRELLKQSPENEVEASELAKAKVAEAEKLYTVLKNALTKYWDSVMPWEGISAREGAQSVAEIQDRLLEFLTYTQKNKETAQVSFYLADAARVLLDWMKASKDPYDHVWADRLAYLFFSAHGSRDFHRTNYLAYLLAAMKALDSISTKKCSVTWKDAFRTLVSRFETVVNGLKDPDSKDFWAGIAVHYKLKISTDDAELAKLFAASRVAFSKNQSSPKHLQRYAWSVYDCIHQAVRLSKWKLVESFGVEGRRVLGYFGKIKRDETPEGNEKTDALLERAKVALESAVALTERFLSGEEEARQWFEKGEIAKEIATYKEGLVRNPASHALRVGLLEAYLRAGQVQFASSLLSDEMVTVEPLVRITSLIINRVKPSKEILAFYLDYTKRFGEKLVPIIREKADVANGLYRSALSLILRYKVSVVQDYPFVLDVFRALDECKFDWPPKYSYRTISGCIGNLLLRSGQPEAARPYLKKAVRQNANSPRTWLNYGESYAKDSDEAAQCFCRALRLVADDVALTYIIRCHMKDYFEATNQMSRAMYEQKQIDKLSGRLIVKLPEDSSESSSLTLSEEKAEEWQDTPEAVVSNDDIYAQLASRAEELVFDETIDVRGVVVGVLRNRLRVWHEAIDPDVEGTLAYVPREGDSKAVRGMPITLKLMQHSKRPIVVSWSRRPEGKPWDVYPLQDGVVTHVDYNRGFWRIALSGGVSVLVGQARVASVKAFKAGDFVCVCAVKTANEVEILEVKPRDPAAELPAFVRRVEGECVKAKQAHFGRIGEVFVPERLCGNSSSGTRMAVFAVETDDFRKRTRNWLAVAQA